MLKNFELHIKVYFTIKYILLCSHFDHGLLRPTAGHRSFRQHPHAYQCLNIILYLVYSNEPFLAGIKQAHLKFNITLIQLMFLTNTCGI